jgi:hypothetical protein
MLTKEQFEKIPDGEAFATGVLPNSPEGIFMTNSNPGQDLRWVAKKSYGHNWVIYCHWAIYSEDYVKQHGDKVHSEDNIKKCVPCDDDVLSLYRH